MTQNYPDVFDFQGFNAPSRVEADVYDLVIEGAIPGEIDGSWFRAIPDHQFPPKFAKDTYLSGDGMISLLRIRDGHADFKQRYVLTERLKNDRAARRALHGLYRNPYTDDPSVQGKDRTVANTTPVWHGGRLLMTKEDGLPYEVDPQTLETKGQFNYDGRLKSQTFTAHPRLDDDTGEMFFFGYEASGLATRDVAFCIADKNGELVHEEWFEAPFVSLMHDFLVTKEHIIFPVWPITADLARLKAGGAHWVWEPEKGSHIGIMPRGGGVKDLRWFHFEPRSAFHYLNAHSEGSRVHIDFAPAMVVGFPFIQEASGIKVPPAKMGGRGLVRWTFDLAKPGDGYEEHLIGPGGDMPAVARKDAMKDYAIGYYQTYFPQNGAPHVAGPVGAGFNTVARIAVKTGKLTTYAPGPNATVQEHVHIPSKQKGHEGYLIFAVDLHDRMGSEIHLLEAGKVEAGPIARIAMPFRLRNQVHGTWVPA
ncbi:MAG TPA: carotenoid oxygenase family protein [Stellaceae bacterium]